MLVAVSWGRIFPALAKVDRLEDVQPAEPEPSQPIEELVA